MKKYSIIIISGLPCTGKTTLGKYLSEKLELPFIYKDGIKELLFDNLGPSDREWSKKLGRASMALLYYFAEAQLAARKSFIIESNFKPEFDTEKFLALEERYRFSPFQILCKADGKVLVERFKNRDNSTERHQGHVDPASYKEFEELFLTDQQKPLEIGGKIVQLDTTDISSVNYNFILSELNEFAAKEKL